MLQLILGRSGTGKTGTVFERIRAEGARRPQILIVPEQRSHDSERALCERVGAQAALFGEVLSFTRLAGRVFDAHGGGAVRSLDAGGRMLLLYAALRQISEQLTVYRRPSRKPAFLTGMLSTVDELKTCRISSDALWKAGEEAGGG